MARPSPRGLASRCSALSPPSAPDLSDHGFGVGFGGIRFGIGCVLTAFTHMPWGFFGWGLDWGGHSLLFQHQGWYSHSRTLVDWGLPHGGPRAYWGRNMIAGRGGYGRPGYGYGGRSVYDSRLTSRYTPRSFNPGNSAEGFRRYGANEPRTAQAFNRTPAFNARPGYNMPSRSFAPSRSFSPGYDNRSFQSYNRGQTMNSFRPSAPRSMPSYRAYGGSEAFSRGGFDQRSSRSYGGFDQRSARSFSGSSGHAEHFSGGQHFSGGNHSGGGSSHFGGGGHFSGGGRSSGGGHSSHSGGGHHR